MCGKKEQQKVKIVTQVCFTYQEYLCDICKRVFCIPEKKELGSLFIVNSLYTWMAQSKNDVRNETMPTSFTKERHIQVIEANVGT